MFSLELTKEELNALIRYDGVKSVQAISHLLGKIQNATPVVPPEPTIPKE
jgi:hypothetical protein